MQTLNTKFQPQYINLHTTSSERVLGNCKQIVNLNAVFWKLQILVLYLSNYFTMHELYIAVMHQFVRAAA